MKKINLFDVYHIKNFSDISNDNLKKKYPKKFINLNNIHYNLNNININNDLINNVYYMKNKAFSNKNKKISNVFFPFNKIKKDENNLNKNNNINNNLSNNNINNFNENNNKLFFNKNIKTAYDYYKKSKENSNIKNKYIYNMLIPCVKIISSPTNKKTSNFNTIYKTNSMFNNYKTQRIPKKISFSFSKNNYYINKSYNSDNNNMDSNNKILVLNKEELNNHFIFHNKFIKDAIKNIKLKHKNVSSSVNNINNFDDKIKLNNINNNNYLTLDINSNYNNNNINNNINNFYKNQKKSNKETHFNLKKSSSCVNFNSINVKFNKNNFLIHKKNNKLNNNNDNKNFLLKNFYKIFK